MPYWMDQSRGVGNSLDLRGIFLLTAPNMSGKSTLMRAVTVAALLANCGCMVPAKVSQQPHPHSPTNTSTTTWATCLSPPQSGQRDGPR